jgi:cyclase
MFRPRVIPVLLLKGLGLVKTIKFKDPSYIGDPMNAVKIFNDLEADELAFVDITATKEGRIASLNLIKRIVEEAFMPISVGGGICQIKQVKDIIEAGAEKVIINSATISNLDLITKASDLIGSQSVTVSIDVKKTLFGIKKVFTHNGSKNSGRSPIEHAQLVEKAGAGEIIINSIDHEGTGAGYDLELIREISSAVSIPVVALGGAAGVVDFKKAIQAGAHAVAAGSAFVYHGPRRAVLINYPTKNELQSITPL